MRSLYWSFSPKRSSTFSFTSHSPSPSPSRLAHSTPGWSFADSVMTRTLELAEPMITRWNPDSSTFAKVTSLFHENRTEANDFIKYVNNLQKAMHLLVKEDSSSQLLIQAQNLMQIAMKRLQKEFYQILSMNRTYLDPESVSTRSSRASTRSSTSDYGEDGEEDDIRIAGESISEVEDVSRTAMNDLKLIAECMILCGYGKECVRIYKIIRKSIVDEGIFRLGVEKMRSSQIQKMDWEVLELKIKNWLNAVKIAVNTLFDGEKILCDHVFATSDSIRESVFSEISKEGAEILFGFPENVTRSKKAAPEKVFRVLEMYTAISNHWPEIESIFSVESTSTVRSQAITSLIKLVDSVKTALAEFESEIQKNKWKSPVAHARIHHLTIDAMNYLSLLADYSGVLSDILADSPVPESYLSAFDSGDSQLPAISLKFRWLILVLICKVDFKAQQYKDVSLSYLFLANNLQHIITKVRTSNLQYLLGEDWILKHEMKVNQFKASYERHVTPRVDRITTDIVESESMTRSTPSLPNNNHY
ncbi:hypothetical protein LguiB_015684 [Lonicera macranthoides]